MQGRPRDGKRAVAQPDHERQLGHIDARAARDDWAHAGAGRGQGSARTLQVDAVAEVVELVEVEGRSLNGWWVGLAHRDRASALAPELGAVWDMSTNRQGS